MSFNKSVFLRLIPTVIVLVIAALVSIQMWKHYETDPWTRDGRVRADIVQVAPDVSGLVTEVAVHDNQTVKAGDLLFSVDRPRYQLAVSQAEAALNAQSSQLAQARREAARNRQLGDLVATEISEQSDAKVAQLSDTVAQLRVALDTARLNLARTEVRAPVDGVVSNFSLRPGNYASAGKAEFAIIDKSSLHVVGYFEETKLARIHPGDAVHVRLMGDQSIIDGHVESITGGIEERDRNSGANLLANVNPTFSWVRLAQRIPVRIAIDRLPAGTDLVVGRTATVEIVTPKAKGARA